VESLALSLILVSAGSHAVWNYAAKGTREKDAYMLLMNLTSQFTLLPVLVFLIQDWSFPMELVPVLALSAAAEAVYYLALSRAYDAGDLSLVYPIARSSPLFLAVAGTTLLGEKVSVAGALGIGIMVTGVYVINMKELNFTGPSSPLAGLKQPALLFALLAALATTVYTLCDRIGVSVVDPYRYNLWLGIFVTAALTPTVLLRGGLNRVKAEWSRTSFGATASGVLMRGGYILVLLAMKLAPVSYLLSLRQLSVVIGTIIGVVYLKEGFGVARLLGSVTIFIGAFVLAVLA